MDMEVKLTPRHSDLALNVFKTFTETIISQTDQYLVILSSKTYVFEDKLSLRN